jgi:imidazolonepropionase-like amidohydrolase
MYNVRCILRYMGVVRQPMRGYRADVAFDGEKVVAGGALVLVQDGVIIGVEAGRSLAPDGCEVTYLPGTTLLPGLIDAHSHLCGNNEPDALDRLPGLSTDELDKAVEAALAAQLAAGVTAVRDLGDHEWAVVDRHHGRLHGPTVVASGPPITSVGGHCASMGGQASGVKALRHAVRERADRGADLVKIMTSGGVMTPTTDIRACQFSLEEVRAVVDEAHRLGLPVTAHAHALAAVQQCVAARLDGIEHCSCLGEQGIHTPPQLAAAIAAAGIMVCPTLGHDLSRLAEPLPPAMAAAIKRSGVTVEERLAQVGQLHRGGVTLISGVDSGINPVKWHGSLPLAVIELAAAGVPAATALASATSLAAQACGLAARTGRLRTGLDADLLLVNGDPTTDITAIRNARTVVSRGRAISLDRASDLPMAGQATHRA